MTSAPKSRSSKLLHFLASTGIGVVASLLGALLSTISVLDTYDIPAVNVLSRLHWLAYATGFAVAYFLTCYAVSKLSATGGILKYVFRVPVWTELRGFGDQRIARMSYVVLVAIPAIAYFLDLNPLNIVFLDSFQLPLNMKMTFFASWYFSLALIIFAVGCPKQFRKTDVLSQAKNINLVLSEVKDPRIIIEKEEEFEDPVLDQSFLEARALCFLFYGLGVIYAVMILIRSAIFVVNA